MSVQAEQVLVLEGALTMETAASRLAEGRRLASSGNLLLDLSAVTDSDSAALALIIDWVKTARAAGHGVAVQGMPAGISSLAELYGVAELLPLNEAAASV